MTSNIGFNWAGTHEYGALQLHRPSSVEQIQELIAAGGQTKALGTRHSFNDIADSPGALISTADLPTEISIDPDSQTARITGGASYGVVATHLQKQGFALHNMGSLPHISVAGACSTGTHGSGNNNGNLATAVTAIDLVTGDGELQQFKRGDARFQGAVVGLGALGIITAVTLEIEPSYEVRQDVYLDLPWAAVFADFEAITASAYSVSLFTDWRGDTLNQLWLKSRLDQVSQPRFPDRLFGATRSTTGTNSPANGDLDNTTIQGGIPGPWLERLPHFRLEATPSNGDEIQTEYFIDRRHAVSALSNLRELSDAIASHILISEFRTVAADELWLSPANQRASLGIHFTWKNEPEAVSALLPQIEAALMPFAPRPHWGKWFSFDHDHLARQYGRFDDFRALAAELDPRGQFRNAYLDRILGV